MLFHRPVVAIIDDDDAYVQFMYDLLDEEGWEARHVPPCIATADTIAHQQPDLILIDPLTHYPRCLDIVQRLYHDPRTAHVPMIICSSIEYFQRHNTHVLDDIVCPMVDKPFDLSDLLSKLNTVLRQPQLR